MIFVPDFSAALYEFYYECPHFSVWVEVDRCPIWWTEEIE